MTPTDSPKPAAELLDLPILDKNGRYCGIVDNIEFAGGSEGTATMTALLVGPGAWVGRLPRWGMALVRLVAGERMVRVDIAHVERIASAVQLDCPASELGLGRIDDRLRSAMPKWGAL
ncbi:hypothetical protein ACFSCW_09450 [Sphingomonas tabacisoli]|uniref:PRC-barrel domain-containing protein n=1 Tax=Sphingomonas tabacisoli TaxID=2249466 RepID=A0ABW4I272_9SPHN